MLRFNRAFSGHSEAGSLFQYILCYGSTYRENSYRYYPIDISIHPMLRFNEAIGLVEGSVSAISIHPMLRFNISRKMVVGYFISFQYILCYGSTVMAVPLVKKFDKISIHPMLRFNHAHVLLKFIDYPFQYILCYGSTKLYKK